MNKHIERWYPLAAGLAVAAVYYFFYRSWTITDAVLNLLLAIVSIAAIAVGFLATAKSILISIDDKLIIQRLKRVGYYKILIGYLLSAVWWSLGLSVFSALCLLIDWKDAAGAWWNRPVLALWVCVLVTSLLACARVIYIFGKILSAEDPTTTTGS
jgi:hypothetical protein